MYNYEIEKKWIYTDEGMRQFVRVRDKALSFFQQAGAARMQELMRGESGSSWQIMACVDRIVEMGEMRELTPKDTPGQFRVFVRMND